MIASKVRSHVSVSQVEWYILNNALNVFGIYFSSLKPTVSVSFFIFYCTYKCNSSQSEAEAKANSD